MSDEHHRQIQDIGWTECLVALFLILIPTAFCSLVRKRWILTYQRELLTCSLGTMFAIVFVDLVPELIEDARTADHKPIWLSMSIFGGIAFAFMMNTLHDAMEHKSCDKCDDDSPCDDCKRGKTERIGEMDRNSPHHQTNDTIKVTGPSGKEQAVSLSPNIRIIKERSRMNAKTTKSQKRRLPCQVKIFLAATTIDFLIDGFIIACEGIVISIALLPHEFVHVLGDVVFLVNFGLGKRQAVLLRLVCQLATPISGCLVKMLRDMYRETLDTMHTYGHGFIAGIFLYVLMIDILPMIEEGHLESHQHHPHLEPRTKQTHSSSREQTPEDQNSDNAEKSKSIPSRILLPVLFVICFGITGSLIYCKEHIEAVLKG